MLWQIENLFLKIYWSELQIWVIGSFDFYSLGKQIFDPPVDVWWVDDDTNKTKCIYFLFYDWNNPSMLLLLQTLKTSSSTAVKVFLTLAANQIADSPATQQL